MANGKKLMVVIPTLSGGGAERVATTLLHSLPHTVPGIEQVVVLFGTANDVALPVDTRVRFLGLTPNGSPLATVTRFFRLVFRLAAIIREERPYTVLSFMDYTNIVAILANWLAAQKCRLVVSVRTRPSAQTRQYATNQWERLLGVMIRWMYNRADAIIAVSRDASGDLTENFHVDKRIVSVINNPVDREKIFHLGAQEVLEAPFDDIHQIILSVGRLSAEKGHATLLKAFYHITDFSSARLVLVGEGAEEGNLRQIAKDLGIEERVFFLGFQSNPFKYMRRSTIFVLSSIYEGFVNVVVEAMACGLPVVATRASSDIDELVDGSSGLVVAVGDDVAMADAMIRLLNDAELRTSMSKEMVRKLAKYSVEEITGKYVGVLGL